MFASVAWNTRPVSAEEQAEVARIIEQETKAPYTQRELRRCVDKPQRYGIPEGTDVQSACEDAVLPRPEYFSSRQVLSIPDEMRGSGIAIVVVLVLFVMLLGTTFVGHDWNTGSMSNQLLFDPRRVRVWAAKCLAVFAVGLAVATMVLTAYWFGLGRLVAARDLETPPGVMLDAYQQGWRGAALVAAAGLGGFALTMLFRSTVVTLGILFAVSLAGPLLLLVTGIPGNERLMPQNNALAYLEDGLTVVDYDDPSCFDGPSDDCATRISRADGALYFGGLLVLACAPSVLSFRRRDVP